MFRRGNFQDMFNTNTRCQNDSIKSVFDTGSVVSSDNCYKTTFKNVE